MAIFSIKKEIWPCAVPVFRYAIERWRPDPYAGVYLYKDKISEDDRKLLDQLRSASENPDITLNLLIKEVEIDSLPENELADMFKGSVPDDLPSIALWYPYKFGEKPPFMIAKLTPSFVEGISLSPKRKEMAENLINGESIVWIYVRTGNMENDEEALSLIKQELKIALKKSQENPFYVLSGNRKVKLHYGYPLLEISPDDPEEKYFIKMLLGTEPDLHEHTDEPMVFPVFGRGRVLGCLFGEYINPKLIQDSVSFLTGMCSCEVKALNPGTDLLMAAPWEVVNMDYSFVDEVKEDLPELSGVMPDSPGESVNPDETVITDTTDDKSKTNDSLELLKEAPICNTKSPISREPVAGLNIDLNTDREMLKNRGNVFLPYGITLGSLALVVVISGIVMTRLRKNK